MHLKNIKLAGFKSFVDPTIIPIESQLCAVVGPNGCGKSNVVDAIRWVIGESSAKQLRGQSMADVIFNGTHARKPVGRASVELAFDNSDGRLSGEFAKYNEVSIRREVERDGQSNYYINGTKCRRRDILDLFLGTGLGQHSYAIIEQGMISQIIEAKPDDIRVYLEEAAGISVYKERRKDTESRIQRTQENIDRLNDLCEELDRQLRHLKRQANAAERFNEFKHELQLSQAQMKGLQWKLLNTQNQQLSHHIAQHSDTLEENLTQQITSEAQIEQKRLEQDEHNEQQQAVQKNYYDFGVDITRIEEQLQNSQKQIEHWQKELRDLQVQSRELTDNHQHRQQQIQAIKIRCDEAIPKKIQYEATAELAQNVLSEAENTMEDWQQEWDELQQEISHITQQKEIFKLKIVHHQQQLQELKDRLERLQNSLNEKSFESLDGEIQEIQMHFDEAEEQCLKTQDQLKETIAAIQNQGQSNERFRDTLNEEKKQLHVYEKEYASLDAVQKNALGENHQHIKNWLTQHDLQSQPRLAKTIQVEAGWEVAVETALQGYMDAVCTSDISSHLTEIEHLPQGKLTLLAQDSSPAIHGTTKTTLSSKVQCDWPLGQWLSHIYVVENINEALAARPTLSSNESIMTRDGIWVGKNWGRVIKTENNDSGILVREQALNQLTTQVQESQLKIETLETELQHGLEELQRLERTKEQQNQAYQQLNTLRNQIHTQITVKQSDFQQLKKRHSELQQEFENCTKTQENHQMSLEQVEQQLEEIQTIWEEKDYQKQELAILRDQNRQALETAKKDFQQAQQKMDELSLQVVTDQKQLQVLEQTLTQSERQIEQLTERKQKLGTLILETEQPLEIQAQELQKLLQERLTVEQHLKQVQAKQETINQELRQLEKGREQYSKVIQELRQSLQELQLKRQDAITRQSTFADQIQESGFELQTLLENLTDESIEHWENKIATLNKQIERLGPINLAAIEEYKSIAERKEYLDKQLLDLTEALNILDKAMQKIDRETQTRFEDTFTKINEGFQLLFPKIFGGGKAYLEPIQENSLEGGILVRAQPPGKRNSSIHVLSGGEKALTAIALLFSMFQLNPAPFCILDEVDAPLDDANVGRFCQLVKEMSAQIQFIVISHNKVTISTATQLMGVTMQEPGVSRIVSVNVAEAIEMAT